MRACALAVHAAKALLLQGLVTALPASTGGH